MVGTGNPPKPQYATMDAYCQVCVGLIQRFYTREFSYGVLIDLVDSPCRGERGAVRPAVNREESPAFFVGGRRRDQSPP